MLTVIFTCYYNALVSECETTVQKVLSYVTKEENFDFVLYHAV